MCIQISSDRDEVRRALEAVRRKTTRPVDRSEHEFRIGWHPLTIIFNKQGFDGPAGRNFYQVECIAPMRFGHAVPLGQIMSGRAYRGIGSKEL